VASKDHTEHTCSPRVKQMIVGRVELPRRQEAPPLVCVEPVQLPIEGVLAARGLSPVLPSANQTAAQSMTSHATREAQLTNSCRRAYVHVMVVNFSQEEIVLPKATVLGVAEEISPCCGRNKWWRQLQKLTMFRE